MRCIEDYLRDPEHHLLLAEDGNGLFMWHRLGTDRANQAAKYLRSRPDIKWVRIFSNQREDNPTLGASEAVAAIFQEIRQRNLRLSPHLDQLLNEEIDEEATKKTEAASPSR